MKVLLVGSEVSPIIKLGGLGDVMGSLPKELVKLKIDVDVIVPYFPVADISRVKIIKQIELQVPYGGATHTVDVFKTKLPGSSVDVFLLRNTKYFNLGGLNAFLNTVSETDMFVFFNRAVTEFIKAKFNTYDIIHANDWHTGLLNHLLETEIGSTRPATLFTIHNLAYQGIGGLELVKDLGFYPGEHPIIDNDVLDGTLNMMQQGLSSSDYINTVSPSYAKEILYKDIGGEMTDILLAREGRLVGILNGLDYSQFPRDFNTSNWKEHKSISKKSIQKQLLLDNSDKPIFSFISRLDPNQKGLDILLDVIPRLITKGAQVIILGKGDPHWENTFQSLLDNDKLKGNISINIKFDTSLALDIYKASDFFIIPSRYEPCGLTQMISMWYGTIPIAHAVGGLKDSIVDNKNGFTFNIYSSTSLFSVISNALELYKNKPVYEEMVLSAMQTDFSWTKSAEKYYELYKEVINLRQKSIHLAEVNLDYSNK